MHVTTVRLKSGAVLSGYLWEWRPVEGWFSLGAEDDLVVIRLGDVQEAVEKGVRVNVHEIKDVDLLQRAVEEGWGK